MKDDADRATPELEGLEKPKRGRGQPKKHHTEAERLAAQAEAARAYRAKKKAALEARRKPDAPVTSAILDLSKVRQW